MLFLSSAAFLLLLIYTLDSQATDKVEGVGDDFVGDGQDKTPIKQKSKSFQRFVVSASTPTVTVNEENEQYIAPWTEAQARRRGQKKPHPYGRVGTYKPSGFGGGSLRLGPNCTHDIRRWSRFGLFQ